MKTLITGSTGFIGSRLSKAAADQGYDIRKTSREKSPGSFAVWNIGPDTNWFRALQGIKAIVHLAARAHVLNESKSDPLSKFRKINTLGTLNLARQAARIGVKRFVYISSIGVNGNQNTRPFTENDVPAPVAPYAVSKLEAEQGLMDIAGSSDMEVVIIRPPLVYGPNAPGNFGRLVSLVQKGIPLPFGSVHNRRSLVALDNLVDFILLCLEHPMAVNEVFLISDGEDVSTTELLQRIGNAFRKRLIFLPVPVGLMKLGAGILGKKDIADRLFCSLLVDSSKSRKVLGWKPLVSMDEQLRTVGREYDERNHPKKPAHKRHSA